MENKIMIGYTVDGIAYTNQILGSYRILDPSLYLVSMWVGVDADPDLTLPPDATDVFFPSVVITPPVSGVSEYRITCRRTDEYGITSWDNDYQSIWVDAAGYEVVKSLNAPVDITLANRGGGVAYLRAKYQSQMDADPADEWRIYYTTNGVDPDPAIDTPIEVLMSDTTQNRPSQFDSGTVLYYDFSTLPFNTDLRVIIRTFRSSDSAESENITVYQLYINTVVASLAIVPQISLMMETDYAGQKPSGIQTDILVNGWGITTNVDELLLYSGSNVVIRSTIREYNQGRIYIPASLVFSNVAHSAAAVTTTDLIEVIDANTAYILVGSTRRAKIDLTAGTIEAAEFDLGIGITEDIPVNAYSWGNSTETYLLQYNPVRGRFVPWLKLTSAGVLSTAFAVTQRRS
jgi:hypothetical protein